MAEATDTINMNEFPVATQAVKYAYVEGTDSNQYRMEVATDQDIDAIIGD